MSGLRSFFFPLAPEPPGWVRKRARDDKWTISQERVFMEDLVYKRLTLFLAVSAALVAAVVDLEDRLELSVPLLFFGVLLCWTLQQSVHRAQLKLDIILKILFADDHHPTGYINTALPDRNRVQWVGYLVPSVVSSILTMVLLVEGGYLALRLAS